MSYFNAHTTELGNNSLSCTHRKLSWQSLNWRNRKSGCCCVLRRAFYWSGNPKKIPSRGKNLSWQLETVQNLTRQLVKKNNFYHSWNHRTLPLHLINPLLWSRSKSVSNLTTISERKQPIPRQGFLPTDIDVITISELGRVEWALLELGPSFCSEQRKRALIARGTTRASIFHWELSVLARREVMFFISDAVDALRECFVRPVLVATSPQLIGKAAWYMSCEFLLGRHIDFMELVSTRPQHEAAFDWMTVMSKDRDKEIANWDPRQ